MYSVEDGMDGDFWAVAAGFDPADDEDADVCEDEDDVLPVTLPPLYMTSLWPTRILLLLRLFHLLI